MEFKLMEHDNKYKYVEYTTNKGIVFNNSDYWVLDLLDKKVQEQITLVGGYNRTIVERFILKENLENVSKILFCCYPTETVLFKSKAMYIDEDFNVKGSVLLTYQDFLYFRNYYSYFIKDKGSIYDLLDIGNLKSETSEFCFNPKLELGIHIDDKEITLKDELVTDDVKSFISEKYWNLMDDIKASKIVISFSESSIDGDAIFKIIKEDGSFAQGYNIIRKMKTEKEYIDWFLKVHPGSTIEDIELDDPFSESIQIKLIIENLEKFSIIN